MKELFRDPDVTRVGFFQSILESENIPTMIRNRDLTSSGITGMPIPEFYPALCVMNDEDYPRAVQIIREQVTLNGGPAGEEIRCATCGEINPGTFDVCWSCGKTLRNAGPGSPASGA